MAISEQIASLGSASQWALSLLMGTLTLLVAYLIKFYASRRYYPPGPFPLPLLGNILRKISKF